MNRNTLIFSVTKALGTPGLPVADTEEHSLALFADGVAGGVCDVVNHAGSRPVWLRPRRPCVDGARWGGCSSSSHHSCPKTQWSAENSPRRTGSQAFINTKEEQKGRSSYSRELTYRIIFLFPFFVWCRFLLGIYIFYVFFVNGLEIRVSN